MTRSTLRTASVALAVAATLLLAGCSSDGDADSDTSADAAATTAAAEDADPNAPVEVPDVTNLLLQTAQDNIEAKGLTVEIVDESGAALVVDDATAFTVAAQDPADGTVDPGSAVTLTVAPRG